MEWAKFYDFLAGLWVPYLVLHGAVILVYAIDGGDRLLEWAISTGKVWPACVGGALLLWPLGFFPAKSMGVDLSGGAYSGFVFLSVVGVFLFLWVGFWIARSGWSLALRWFVPCDIVTPHACKVKRDLESLMICLSKKFEHVLESWLGAEGKGLHEKVTSVEAKLDPSAVQGLRRLASIRNKVVHHEEFDESSVCRKELLSEAVEIMNGLADAHDAKIGAASNGWVFRFLFIPVISIFGGIVGLLYGYFSWVGAGATLWGIFLTGLVAVFWLGEQVIAPALLSGG